MLTFELKATALRAKRYVADARARVRRWPTSGNGSGTLLAEIVSPLRSTSDPRDPGEARLVAGKIENLRIALRRLDGVVVAAGGTFSFWAQIGRATRRKGYVEGRELREGCIIPTLGGGLCQLSNALYAAALDAGCEILERHAHSQVVPGSAAARDRDATVFWNYVDLRFRSEHALTIRARLEANELILRFMGTHTTSPREPARTVYETVHFVTRPSCFGCAETACSRHRGADHATLAPRTAFLLDAYWPEHDAFVRDRTATDDVVCLPLDGTLFRLPQYAWSTSGFARVRQAPLETLARALRSRRLATHGAARQRALLYDAEHLARRFAAQLTPDIEHVVVMQNLLPYLWRSGHLGGRTFDVLMCTMPMHALHAVLDDAARRHPESSTLSDFRAPRELVDAEEEALARPRLVVTPHHDIARRFGERALVLPWAVPPAIAQQRRMSEAILFAGGTLGRSGAYEMREAARRLGVGIVLVGNHDAEGADFWRGLDVTRATSFSDGLRLARAVALPAFVEHRPRLLLHALAAGAAVVASTACGLAPQDGLTVVTPGDVDGLCGALSSAIIAPLTAH
jgi:VanW like protein